MTLNLMASGFIQNSGTTMGTKWSPHYADIEMALETFPHKQFIYLRYLDDIHVFIIWHHGRTAFSELIDIFNSHQPPIRFQATIPENFIDFLDTTIYKDPKYPNSLLTKVYFKPTDIHQLLDKTSFHPKHTFSGILKFKTVLELKYKILDKELTKSSLGPSKARSFKCGKGQCKKNMKNHRGMPKCYQPCNRRHLFYHFWNELRLRKCNIYMYAYL